MPLPLPLPLTHNGQRHKRKNGRTGLSVRPPVFQMEFDTNGAIKEPAINHTQDAALKLLFTHERFYEAKFGLP